MLKRSPSTVAGGRGNKCAVFMLVVLTPTGLSILSEARSCYYHDQVYTQLMALSTWNLYDNKYSP